MKLTLGKKLVCFIKKIKEIEKSLPCVVLCASIFVIISLTTEIKKELFTKPCISSRDPRL